MKSMVPLINVPCDTLMKKIEKAAETGETFDIVKYQQAVTVEIILSIVFGIQSDCQMNPDDPLMARALDAMQPTPFKQLLFNVILPILPLGSYFTQSEMGAKYIFSSMYDLASFTRSVINERKELKTSRKDLLDLMLKAADPSNKSDKRLTEDEVVSQCIIFFLGGYETTSTTLALTCHNIATHPDVQLKLQQEIDSVWTDEDQMPSYDTVHKLPYLDMVISETLRMYPPGTLLTRTCMKECTIQGIRIPKGCDIFVTSYSMQRDPRNYPDPEKFDPERFSPEAKQARDPYTFLPFGHGPRDCIGKRFAFMEMKLVLSRILRRYDIKTTPETEIPPNVGVKNTLSVIGGVKVAVSPRVKNG
ncbi:cytochrome P450 3A19 isoform X2 [Nematostella vectensis]|nr:cytochrome P450 3A19 isoform X2 [Nematostella vectensis]